jgi:hypothetical protein
MRQPTGGVRPLFLADAGNVTGAHMRSHPQPDQFFVASTLRPWLVAEKTRSVSPIDGAWAASSAVAVVASKTRFEVSPSRRARGSSTRERQAVDHLDGGAQDVDGVSGRGDLSVIDPLPYQICIRDDACVQGQRLGQRARQPIFVLRRRDQAPEASPRFRH